MEEGCVKRLYTRVVRWLIRPALEDVERRMTAKIESETASRIDGDMSLWARITRQ